MITFNIRLRLGILVGKGGDLDLEYFNINCCGQSYKASRVVNYVRNWSWKFITNERIPLRKVSIYQGLLSFYSQFCPNSLQMMFFLLTFGPQTISVFLSDTQKNLLIKPNQFWVFLWTTLSVATPHLGDYFCLQIFFAQSLNRILHLSHYLRMTTTWQTSKTED